MIVADNQCRDTEGANSSRLGVALRGGKREHDNQSPSSRREQRKKVAHLLNARNMPRDVLDGYGVLDGQTVGLALGASAVDEHTSVGGETCMSRPSAPVKTNVAAVDALPPRWEQERREEKDGPANPRQMWSSSIAVLRTVRGS